MNKFVILFIDDKLISFKTAKDLTKYLKIVLHKLRDNNLYANGENKKIGLIGFEFLEHIIIGLCIKQDI